MGFIEGFSDELKKTAAAAGPLRGIARQIPRFAGLAAVGGGGAALGHGLGKRQGERKGLAESAALTDDIAQRAYRAGMEHEDSAIRDAMLQAGGGASEDD